MKAIDFLRDIFGKKSTIYLDQKFAQDAKYHLTLSMEMFFTQMAINMLSGLIAKCEFKTYIRGKENKADEYYLWNVEPNVNQNSSQFIQQLVSRLLYVNEALVIDEGDQLLIADGFTRNDKYAVYPNTFTDVRIGDLSFEKTFYMPDVLYFRLNNENIRGLLSGMMAGYRQLMDMAVGKYKRAGGRKGTVELNKGASGDKDFKDKLTNLFTVKFKNYFEAENAIVDLPSGVKYNEISGEGSKKSTSEVKDITDITKEALSRVAQAFRIPPALLQGDIADTDKLVDELLTFGLDPIVDLLQTEINRKRYGKAAYLAGSMLRIDTTRIKHVDIFSVAEAADKLIADSIYSVDEIREKIGDAPLNTWWSKQHVRTKNYESLTEKAPKGGENDGKNTEAG